MTQRIYRNGETTVAINAKRQGDEIVLEMPDGPQRYEWQELSAGEYLLRSDGKQQRVVVAQDGADRWVWVDGHVHHLVLETSGGAAQHASSDSLLSPMPGLVLKVLVATGDAVTRNQALVVLEAMKMQYEITAPRDGKVAQVPVAAGKQVDGGVPLIVLEEEA